MDNTKKQTNAVPDNTLLTTTGFMNIQNNPGSGQQPRFKLSGGLLEYTGAQQTVPAIVINDSVLPVSPTQGYNSLTAALIGQTPEAQELERQKLQALSGSYEKLPDYNTTGITKRILTDVGAGLESARKSAQDVVRVGIGQGTYWNAVKSDFAERKWRFLVDSEGKDTMAPFAENNIGIYTKRQTKNKDAEGNEVEGWSELFTPLGAIEKHGGGKGTYATLDISKLKKRVVYDDGTYEYVDLSEKEKEIAEAYRDLNRQRLKDETARTLSETFDEEFANRISWGENFFGASASRNKLDRKLFEVVGSAVPSVLVYELAGMGAMSALNVGTKAVKAVKAGKSIKTALTTFEKAGKTMEWTGNMLLNPYLLSEGGGIIATGASDLSVAALAYMQEFESMRTMAISAGWDPITAGNIAHLSASVVSFTEAVPWHAWTSKYYKNGNSFKQWLTHTAFPESGEEMVQEVWEAYAMKHYGMSTANFREIAGNVFFAGIGGFVGASIGGGIHTGSNIATAAWGSSREVIEPPTLPKYAPTSEQLDAHFKAIDERNKQNREAELENASRLFPANNGSNLLPAPEGWDNRPSQQIFNRMTPYQQASFQDFMKDMGIDGRTEEETLEALRYFFNKGDATVEELMAMASNMNLNDEAFKANQDKMRYDAIIQKAHDAYAMQAKNINPKITKAQIEEGWAAVKKLMEFDMQTGAVSLDVTQEYINSAEGAARLQWMLDAQKKLAAKQTIQQLKAEIGKNANTQPLQTALSDSAEYLKKYDAQWEVASEKLENQVARATGDRNLGKAIAALVKQTFYNQLAANPETNPVAFVSALSPVFSTQASLRRNGRSIEGLEGINGEIEYYEDLNNLSMNTYDAGNVASWIQQLENPLVEQETKEQLVQTLHMTLFGGVKEEIDTQDLINFLKRLAYEEQQLSTLMQNTREMEAYTNPDFAESSYIQIAVMRLKGMNQAQIDQALSLGFGRTAEQSNLAYEQARNMLFPDLPASQLDRLRVIGESVKDASNSGTIEGYYANDGEDTQRPEIFLGENANAETVTHEVGHWIDDIAERIANYELNEALVNLKDPKTQPIGVFSEKGATDNKFVNPGIAALFNNIKSVISNRFNGRITRVQLHETAVDVLTRYLSTYKGTNTLLHSAFKDLLDSKSAKDTVEDSLYDQLTKQDKTQLKQILNEHFNSNLLQKAADFNNQADTLSEEFMKDYINRKSDDKADRVNKIYNSLMGRLMAIKNPSGPINHLIHSLLKAKAEWKNGASSSQKFEADIVNSIGKAVRSLRARANKYIVSPLLAKSKAEEDLALTKKEIYQNASSPELANQASGWQETQALMNLEAALTEDEETAVTYDEDGEGRKALYFYKRKHFKTSTQRMRGMPSVLNRLWDTIKHFSPARIKEAMSEFTISLSALAGKIHPELKAIIQKIAYEVGVNRTRRSRAVSDWLNMFEKYNDWAKENGKGVISRGEMFAWKHMLIEHKRSKAFANMIERFKANPELQNELADVLTRLNFELDACYDFLLSVGFSEADLAPRKDFFPSKVEQHEAFANLYQEKYAYDEKGNLRPGWDARLIGKGPEGQLGKTIRASLENRQGKPDIRIVANTINSFLTSPYAYGPSAPSMHTKVMETVPADFVEFYADPFDTLADYFSDISTKEFNYQLVGKIEIDSADAGTMQKQGIAGQVGEFLAKMRLNVDGKYPVLPSSDLEEQFQAAIFATVNRSRTKKGLAEPLLNQMKIWQGIATLGKITAFINQYYELVPIMINNGFFPTASSYLKAFRETPEFRNGVLEMLGLNPLSEHQRMDEKGMAASFYRWLLKVNGFTKTDILLKVTNAYATLKSANMALADMANGEENLNTRTFQRRIQAAFAGKPEAMQKCLQALRENKMTDEVKFFLRTSIAEMQPVDATEISWKYNQYGAWGRSAMFLTSTVIKQIGFFYNYFASEFREKKSPAAALAIARFVFFAVSAGVPIEWFKDIMRGKQPNVAESAFFSPLQFFMLDRYMITMAKDKGILTAFLSRFVPHMIYMDDIWKAAVNLDPWMLGKHVPLVDIIDAYGGRQREMNLLHGEAINTYDSFKDNFLFGGK